jgi:hypothetical protein
MAATFHCPSCRKKSALDPALAGRSFRCPRCGQTSRSSARPVASPPESVHPTPAPADDPGWRTFGVFLGGISVASVLVIGGLVWLLRPGPGRTPAVAAAPVEAGPAAVAPIARPADPSPPFPPPPPPPAPTPDAPPTVPTPPPAAPAKKEASPPPVPPTAPAAAVPKLAAKVRWAFKEGSSGFTVQPHIWKATVELKPTDDVRWTVVPDLVLGEVSGTEALSQGVSANGFGRCRLVFFGVPNAATFPSDTSGAIRPLLQIGNMYTIGPAYKREWRLNGKSALWKPTPLTRDDRLECVWEHATGTTIKWDLKAKPDYRPYHLGPLLYDPATPDGPCYAVAAFGRKGTADEWLCDQPDLIPLTEERIRREVADATRPDHWRMQFLVWYWDQQRRVKGAADILLRGFQGTEYTPLMKLSAAKGLLAIEDAPGVAAVLARLRDRGTPAAFREDLVQALEYHKAAGLAPATDLARDRREEKALREAAIDALATYEADGWKVIEGLKGDPDVGPKVKKMLDDHKKDQKR